MNKLSMIGSLLMGAFITAGCSSSDETVSPLPGKSATLQRQTILKNIMQADC